MTATMTPANGTDRSALVRAAQGKTAPTQRVPMGIRVVTGPGTSAASVPQPTKTVGRPVEKLLSVAAASESARTRQLAEKISGLLEELTGRVEAEEAQRREREAAEEQRRKLAEAEAALARQLAEVRQKLRTTGRDSAASPSRDRQSAEQRAAIRKWAVANGYDVKDRGRIPREVVQAWAAATGSEVAR
ncbi:Lsr2 family DNA-binding protein [Micromonospora maris]|uniref:Lsr2 family DNA-binding protein n=1 Tax=Micromonospora maris TaxID=1003110 RepID=UPI0002E62EBC|nr:histone-like nucleoid-structuring protein Lsr2 [Micromonospora maris]